MKTSWQNTEKNLFWSNVAVGRILSNEQYTGTMVYNNSFKKSENVGDKHARPFGGRIEAERNCHVAIISREDFEKVAAMRKGNTCAGAERKHETHCLTGKMICGNCGHRLSHSYTGRPKYYCAKHYLDKADGKCNISVLDATSGRGCDEIPAVVQ
ncbi:MAG: recombinase family protein [Lachnospira eligens]